MNVKDFYAYVSYSVYTFLLLYRLTKCVTDTWQRPELNRSMKTDITFKSSVSYFVVKVRYEENLRGLV